MKKHNFNLILIILLAILHFLCDLICGYKIVGIYKNIFIDNTTILLFIFLVYNGLAFLFQPLIGLFVDKYHQEQYLILIPIILLVFGLIIEIWWLSAILLGIGNQIFHVIGGKICTNISTKKAKHLGVFVSTGAIGLAIGSYLSNLIIIPIVPIILFIVITIAVYLILKYQWYKYESSTVVTTQNKKKSFLIITIILVILAVFIRSFLGKILHYDFIITTNILLAFALASTIGKMIGGFISDLIGSLKTIIISMILTTILLIFFDNNLYLTLLGIVMINISMPITLYELNRLMPRHEGLNFGILAAILFVGFFVAMAYQYEIISYIILVVISSILTILAIGLASLYNKEKSLKKS